MYKSATDNYWNERATQETNVAAVNIADVTQRELETEFLLKHLKPTDNILEVGCGNGFLTNILRERVKHVDGFDYAENMIKQAIDQQGQKNNRFFHDNVLAPANWRGTYDAIVCVRVLINLRNLEEQRLAIDHMHEALPLGGRLLLIEGYLDGFLELNRVRERAGLEKLKPAAINFYSALDDVRAHLDEKFTISDEFHSGSFDFLTRVVYPTLVGSGNATGHSDFHQKIRNLAATFNPDAFRTLGRLRGYALVKG